MRYGWLMAAVAVLCIWPVDLAAGQEGSGEEAKTEEAESEEARRARLRRLRMGNEAKLEFDGKTVKVTWGNTPTDSPDHAALESLKDGDVVQLTKSIVTKLATEVDLKFGDADIKTENVAKDYPGVYGLWLKRTGEGWHLVFNHYADVWGTQHFPEGDVAEVPVEHAKADEATENLTIALEETESGGEIRLTWGEHQWTAAFTVAG